jgi:type 1 glutamine amidotransferase
MSAPLRYKFVELSTVTDEEIERAVNEWVARGWTFDGMHFAMRDASRRPAMAFLTFTRPADEP